MSGKANEAAAAAIKKNKDESKSDTTQKISVIYALPFFKHLVDMPGMEEYLNSKNLNGKAELALLRDLCTDPQLCFFSIKRVVDRQVAKTEKAEKFILDENKGRVKETISRTLNKLRDIQCNICGLCGHSNSSCWLNGQIYNTCRSSGRDAQEANFLWREAIKLQRIAREEGLRRHCATKKEEM